MLIDETVPIRQALVVAIGSAVQSTDPLSERARLEAEHGQVWDATQLGADFKVIGFGAPLVVVHRRSDGQVGSLMFQHHPRLYFAFQAD